MYVNPFGTDKYNPTRPPGAAAPAPVFNATAAYTCNYPGTRVEYSATEVTTTPYPKHYVRSPDIVARAAARVLGLQPSGGATPGG